MATTNKASITRHLFRTACEQVNHAIRAKNDGEVEDEVRFGISAILSVGLAIEGAINDVAESHFDEKTWLLLERAPTVTKWFVLSKFLSENAFLPDAEPLETVRELKNLRNEIAHPKSTHIDHDFIIRLPDGKVIEVLPKKANTPSSVNALGPGDVILPSEGLKNIMDHPIDGATVFQGYGRHLAKFGADSATRCVRRGYAAITKLNSQSTMLKFSWLPSLSDDFPWLPLSTT
jgi:hypothetical protein